MATVEGLNDNFGVLGDVEMLFPCHLMGMLADG